MLDEAAGEQFSERQRLHPSLSTVGLNSPSSFLYTRGDAGSDPPGLEGLSLPPNPQGGREGAPWQHREAQAAWKGRCQAGNPGLPFMF